MRVGAEITSVAIPEFKLSGFGKRVSRMSSSSNLFPQFPWRSSLDNE